MVCKPHHGQDDSLPNTVPPLPPSRPRRRRPGPPNHSSSCNPPPRPAAGAGGEPARPEATLVPTSPRSVEACFRLGLDPLYLASRPLAAFKRAGEPPELAQRRHQHHEALRQVGGWRG